MTSTVTCVQLTQRSSPPLPTPRWRSPMTSTHTWTSQMCSSSAQQVILAFVQTCIWNWILFHCIFQVHHWIWRVIALSFCWGRSSYVLHRCIRYSCVYTLCMSQPHPPLAEAQRNCTTNFVRGLKCAMEFLLGTATRTYACNFLCELVKTFQIAHLIHTTLFETYC